MNPVYQTIFTGPGQPGFGPGNVGDCLRACLASILEVPLDRVPHFADYPASYMAAFPDERDPLTADHGGLWYRNARRWLRDVPLDLVGYQADALAEVGSFLAADPCCWPRHLIGTVPSPRGDFDHSVVLDLDGTVVWDPHPDQDAYPLAPTRFEAVVSLYDPAPPSVDDEAAAGVPLDAVYGRRWQLAGVAAPGRGLPGVRGRRGRPREA